MHAPATELRQEPTPAPKKTWLARLLPIALIGLYVLQCVGFIRTQSLTYDEPVHIAEGLDAWRHSRFEQYNDHPPLARLWCSLPLIDSRWQIDIEQLANSFQVPRITPDPEALAWRARAMNVLLGVVLCWLVWRVADKMFSRGAANFVLALMVFSPSLIAHFSVATTDGASTLLIFAAAWEVVRWRRSVDWRHTLFIGVLLGLMLLAKFSTAPMFVLALLWMLVAGPDKLILNPRRWNWGKTATALLLAATTVWAGYFFHVTRLTVHDGILTASFPHWSEPIVKPVSSRVNYSILVPAGEYVEGIRRLGRHNSRGQPAYFLGQVSSKGGWKLYYPATILLKWPIVVLAACLAGLLLALLETACVPVELWIMSTFPAVYLVLAIFSNFNIGERHILPLYPFALVFAAVLWERVKLRRAGTAALVLLAALNAADTLRCAPDYLSYFSPIAPPGRGANLLTDSNLDWGQGLLALRRYQREHPGEKISLAYFGSVDPSVYGIKIQPLAENDRATGTVIVSATNLSGQFLANSSSYHWVLAYPRMQVLDSCLYAFKIPAK